VGGAEEKPLAISRASGFPVVLFGLTSGCDLRKEGVTVTFSGRQPNNRYQFL